MSTDPASPHLLIVDDSADFRENLQDLLAFFGRSATGVANGQEALDYLRTQPRPKLILLDWQMPGMDGATFLMELILDPILADIPVVITSGYPASRMMIPLCVRCNILEKPFGVESLLALFNWYDSAK